MIYAQPRLLKPRGLARLGQFHPNLVGVWAMAEGAGTLTQDLLFNNPGNFVGSTVKWDTSLGGSVIDFNGSGVSDRVNLGSIGSGNPLACNQNNAFTVISRLRVDNSKIGGGNNFPRIIDKSTSSNAANGWNFYLRRHSPTQFAPSCAVSGGFTESSSSFSIGDLAWSTVAVRFRGTAADFYIGRSKSTNDFTRTVSSNTASAAIGNWNHSTDRQFGGFIEYVMVFDRAIEEALLFDIMDRPYDWIAGEELWIPLDAGGGPAPVNQDTDLRWSLLAGVAQNTDLRWSLFNAISKDATLPWALVNAAQTDSQLPWDVLSAALVDADLRWNVQSALAQVSNDSTLQWSLLVGVQQNADLRWTVQSPFEPVSADSDLRWSLVAPIVQTLETQWSLLQSVGIDADMRWQIAAAVAQSVVAHWSLLSATTQDIDLRWQGLVASEQSVQLVWSIQSEFEIVQTITLQALQSTDFHLIGTLQ